jgi:SAM-dependent methyltransferase
MIFLPGTDKQIRFLLETVPPEGKNILIAGGNTEAVAVKLKKFNPSGLQVITENENDMMEMRMKLREKNIPVKLMDYTNTDYREKMFDIIYAQGTFSVTARRKIYKEMLKILKDEGIICSGEIIDTTGAAPLFMKNIWESSGIAPLTFDKQVVFYNELGLEVIEQKDLSYTLRDFYHSGKDKLSEFKKSGTEDQKTYYKKLLNKISHESNAYLKLGGDKHMEFHVFILKRKN